MKNYLFEYKIINYFSNTKTFKEVLEVPHGETPEDFFVKEIAKNDKDIALVSYVEERLF